MLKAYGETSSEFLLNDRWLIYVRVFDDDGNVVYTSTPVFTVTDPDGNTTNPTAEVVNYGYYRAATTVSVAGRWVATAKVLGKGIVSFAAYVTDITTDDQFPDLADLHSYMTTSATDAQLQDALDAEAAAQRRVCNVPAIYPADLAQALKRRVARNLALRKLPVMVLQGDAETGSLVPPGRDAEVRRLEAGHRKLVLP